MRRPVKPADVGQPLGQFQHTALDQEDIKQLLHTINNAVRQSGERALADHILDEFFATYWPALKERLTAIASAKVEGKPHERNEREIMQEILEGIRGQERRLSKIEAMLPGQSPLRRYGLGDVARLQNLIYPSGKKLSALDAATGSALTKALHEHISPEVIESMERSIRESLSRKVPKLPEIPPDVPDVI